MLNTATECMSLRELHEFIKLVRERTVLSKFDEGYFWGIITDVTIFKSPYLLEPLSFSTVISCRLQVVM